MNRSAFWMIKYMNGSIFSKARYMNGVGFEILARSPVPKLPLSYPPPPPHKHTHTEVPNITFLYCCRIYHIKPYYFDTSTSYNNFSKSEHVDVSKKHSMSGKHCRPRPDAASAASDLGLHCLLILKFPNTKVKFGILKRVMFLSMQKPP